MTMTLNGRTVAAAGTLLDACLAAGVTVDTFCFDDRVSRGGHCRACIVEMDERPVPACTTPARDGATIETDTERLRAYRRDLGALMAAEARPSARVAEVLARWDVEAARYPARHDQRADRTHAYLRFALDACIKCRLCEKVCAEVQGQFVYAFSGRGSEAHLELGRERFSETDCVSCGACAAVCPSGAISDRDRERVGNAQLSTPVRTTCGYCGVGCQIDVHVRSNGNGAGTTDVAWIDGTRGAAVNNGHLCVKGRYAHRFARHPERLTAPLVRKDGRLAPVSWDEAVATVARAFLGNRGRVAALSSSRCTNEENYLVQKWMRAGLGTNNVDCCARVCHAPTAIGMRESIGTGAATNSLDDIERADVILVAGANATEGHPVTGARIKQAVLGGARLVVIDPRRTELAALADAHLQLHPGTNVLLLNSLACALLDAGHVDTSFVAARTEGFEPFAGFVRRFTPEATAAATGVPAALVRRAAEIYGRATRPLQVHGLGMTEHVQGSEAVMLLCNLALMVGAVGHEGVGVNPLRGQNNVQGAADMGCQPDLLPGYQSPRDRDVAARFTAAWGRALPADTGLTIPKIYDAARRGEIRALFILGEDVVQTDPGSHVHDALEALDCLVVQELFLSETAKRAHVVLPGASFLEKDGTFTNGERRIQRVRRVLDPLPGTRADWVTITMLMAATGYPQSYTGPADIMDEIASLVPAFAGVSYDRLDGEGLQWPVPDARHPGTAILHRASFPRGKAHFACVDFVASAELDRGTRFPLCLTTGRRLEHYNCGSMTRRSENLALAPRDELEISAPDALLYGVRDGEDVRVRSAHGEAVARACVSDRVTPGTVFLTFHFPETHANALIGATVDRLADCPEYKVTAVSVEPA